MKVADYKGFEINFDENYEVFYTSLDESRGKDSKSFKAVKTAIDTFLKDNKTFKPFKIRSAYHLDSKNIQITDKIIEIIGIHGNGNVIYLNNGKKEQLAFYNHDDYILEDLVDEKIIVEARIKEIEIDEKKKELYEIYKKVKIKTLQDYLKEKNV